MHKIKTNPVTPYWICYWQNESLYLNQMRHGIYYTYLEGRPSFKCLCMYIILHVNKKSCIFHISMKKTSINSRQMNKVHEQVTQNEKIHMANKHVENMQLC